MSATPDPSKSRRLPPPPRQNTSSASRWRRRKMTTVKLGSRRRSLVWRAGKVFVSAMRRMKLRLVTAQCSRALKKLRNCYAEFLNDLAEGGAAMETAQTKMFTDRYLYLPIFPAVPYYYRSGP